VAKIRLFEPLHAVQRLIELSEKLYICFLFFISIVKWRYIAKWYCGS